MCCKGNLWQTAGVAAAAFGAGVALTLFLPCEALLVIEAVALIGAGALFVFQK